MKPPLTSTSSVSYLGHGRCAVAGLFKSFDVMLFQMGPEVCSFEVYLATDLGKAECAVVAVRL